LQAKSPKVVQEINDWLSFNYKEQMDKSAQKALDL